MLQQERTQPRAGRLDLLLQDPVTKRRYEVELQLGAVNETHIIRTIEYWDRERKRYPQYDHCAVIVAEEITGRFLNVVSLFNGTIPLVAIKMQAIRVAGKLSLVFVKVLDEVRLGLVNKDEEEEAEPANREYWEGKASKSTLAGVDMLLDYARQTHAALDLKPNKHYIGLERDGLVFNFVTFRPKKNTITLELKLPQSDDLDRKIEEADLDTLDYSSRWGRYRIRLGQSDVQAKSEILTELMRLAYEHRVGREE